MRSGGRPETDLGHVVRWAAAAGTLVVQPRMGMADPVAMAAGLRAVETAPATTIGTITLDSYTRVGDHERAREALRDGAPLNGYPIVAHGPQVTAWVLAAATDGPVQVRHGSAKPLEIFRTLVEAGLSASEGGPVSYCLPYGRTPLAESVATWSEATAELATRCADAGRRAHLETFGGCLLGQLCPPSLLVAMSVLEALFFVQHGVRSVSLSFTQQTHAGQDMAGLAALRKLAGELLPADVDWHVVLYTYMGVFPGTADGARLLLDRSAQLAVHGGAERLIVKTTAETFRLPTVEENVAALVSAAEAARRARQAADVPQPDGADVEEVLGEARALIEAVLGLHEDVGVALRKAFARGLLDVPFCLHEDNRGLTQSTIDEDGRLRWARIGHLPLPRRVTGARRRVTSTELLTMLRHTAEEHDKVALPAPAGAQPAELTGAEPRPYRIAVIGTGPRGLAVVERLAARLAEAPTAVPVELYAMDAVQVGPGRIWRTSQPRWLLMNTPAGEVTMFSGPPDDGPTRAGAGPSLAQWWQAFDPAGHPHAYAPRALYGQYMRYVLNRVDGGLPGWARLHRFYAQVADVHENPDGRYRLTLHDGRQLVVDRVVLTTGHARPTLDPPQRALAEFAASRPHLRYLRGDSAADLPLARIPARARVGVLGLGLSFYDVLIALTVGRGGTFTEDAGGALHYRASGREPHVLAGSRSGIPILARGRNQKPGEHAYRPRLFTHERMLAARARGPLDFGTDVLPWLLAEVDLVYLAAVIRRRFGADVADRFVAEAEAATAGPGDRDADPRAVLHRIAGRLGVGDLPPVDLYAWSRRFAGRDFSGPDEFHRELAALLRHDLDLAEEGNVDGPFKACLDAIRDVRGVIRTAVDYRGLTPASHRDEFLGWFVPVSASLTTGPPRERQRQLLALVEAGVLGVVGPELRWGADPETDAFYVESPRVAGSRSTVDVLIDARIPGPDLRRETGLLALLRDRGLLTNHVNAGPDGDFVTGGVSVTRSPFHPVRADGRPEQGMYVLGIPTEHTRWFTQVGSGRPGTWGDFIADADAIAGDALRGAPLDEIAELAEPVTVAEPVGSGG